MGLLRDESLFLLCGLPSAKLLMACIHSHLLRMPGLLLSIDTMASSTSYPPGHFFYTSKRIISQDKRKQDFYDLYAKMSCLSVTLDSRLVGILQTKKVLMYGRAEA